MGIKASVMVTTYNKNKELPNVFHSLSLQKTDFEYEVCVLDDCSLVDPKSLYDRYLQVEHKKYSRLLHHIGNRGVRSNFKAHSDFTSSYGHTLLMVAEEVEVVVDVSADVLWAQKDILQKLVDSMRPMEIQLCRVVNMPIDPKLHENWEEGIKQILETVHDPKTCRFGDYQGIGRGPFGKDGKNHQWYPFLIPFYKVDCLDPNKIHYLNDNRDTSLSGVLHVRGYSASYRRDIIGIHQAHAPQAAVQVQHDADLINWGPQQPERQEYPEDE